MSVVDIARVKLTEIITFGEVYAMRKLWREEVTFHGVSGEQLKDILDNELLRREGIKEHLTLTGSIKSLSDVLRKIDVEKLIIMLDNIELMVEISSFRVTGDSLKRAIRSALEEKTGEQDE